MTAALDAAGVDVDVRGAPVGSGALAVVLLHGRDQDPPWMYDHVVDRLTPHLTGLPVTWAAPAAPGRSWYAGRVHDPLAETFAERERAAEVVDGLVTALAARGHDPIALAGQSERVVVSAIASHAGGEALESYVTRDALRGGARGGIAVSGQGHLVVAAGVRGQAAARPGPVRPSRRRGIARPAARRRLGPQPRPRHRDPRRRNDRGARES